MNGKLKLRFELDRRLYRMQKVTPYSEHFAQYRLKELPNAEFYYFPSFVSNHLEVFEWLHKNLPWTQQSGVLYGKEYDEPRKKCIFSTRSGREYTYGSITATMLPFPDPLDQIRLQLNQILGINYDCAIVNLYEDGSRYIAPHRDKEKSIVPGVPIASITLGTPRFFDLVFDQPKDAPPAPQPHDKVRLEPISGSLLVMGKDSQVYYKHSVPKQLRIKTPRINLTFRVSSE